MNNKMGLYKCIAGMLCLLIAVGCTANTPLKTVQKKLLKHQNIFIEGQSFDAPFDLVECLDFKLAEPGKMVAEVHSDLIFVNCMFTDFTCYQHKDNMIYSVVFKGRLKFINCIFNGEVDATLMTVENDFSVERCTFAGPFTLDFAWLKGREANFEEAVFHQPAKCVNTIFENKAKFFNTQFQHQVFFQNSHFKGQANFRGGDFNKYTDFSHVCFGIGVHFNQSVFHAQTNMNRAHFMGFTSWTDVCFKSALSIDHTHFIGGCDFRNMTYNEIKHKDTAVFVSTGFPKKVNP